MTEETVKSIKKRAKKEAPKVSTKEAHLSTGSTLLNLACSGNAFGGFMKGSYNYIVGDSTSGKTWLAMTCFAEASNNAFFKDHRLIYDDVENGCLMDIQHYFGKSTFEKIEPPAGDKENPEYSSTIEDFYFNVDDAIKAGKPFIYVLDSMDGLTSSSEIDKFDETKDAMRKGKQVAGSYGDGKAKKNSEYLRRVTNELAKTDSILIIISQTRDNIGFGFEKKTRSGGRALRFYATLEMWSARKGKINKSVKGKQRTIGIISEIGVKKNRITGVESKVEIPIYHSYGIDDVESCINYLMDEGHWSKMGQNLAAHEFDHKGTVAALIQKIEDEGRENELRELTGQVWQDIKEACALKRKKRYE